MSEAIIITEENQGERLDKFLSANLPEKSRSQWQKAIKEGLVLVNGKKPAPHYFLKKGDELNITPETPVTKTNRGFKLDVVYEDDDFLVINKPAGLTVHPPGTNYPEETLIDLLLKKYPELKNVGDLPAGRQEMQLRPGLVHRLDKEVSGLLVVAKNQAAFEHLKNQFQNRTVNKEYLALVHGCLSQPQGIIDLPIDYSTDSHLKMAARPKSQGGKEALTEYEVVEEIKNYSLLKVRIKTGRTHQIRVHLNAIGHPVVGDTVYHPAKMKVKELGRLFLHASHLAFTGLDGQELSFDLDLPKELKNFLVELKK